MLDKEKRILDKAANVAIDSMSKDSEFVKREAIGKEGYKGGHAWKTVVLNHYISGQIINAEWSQNTPGEMTEFLRYTVPDDCVLLVQQNILRAQLFEDDGTTEVLYSEHGLICGLKPQDTLVKELTEWAYDIRAELTYSEQLDKNYLKPLAVHFPNDRGYFLHPHQSLIFQINSSIQLPTQATLHANARWSFPVLMFTQGVATFIEWRTKGLIDFDALSVRGDMKRV